MQSALPETSGACDTHIFEAFAALRERRFEDSIEAAQRALALDMASGLFALAFAAVALGTPARGLELLERAHAADPEAREIADALASLYARVGRINDSLYYAKLSTALPSRPLLKEASGDGLGGFFDNLERGQTDIHHARALRRLDQGNLTEAMAEATSQLELTPGDPASLRTLAFSALRLKETSRAIDAGRALLHSEAATADDLSRHAGALAAAGRFSSSDAVHQIAETIAPDEPLFGQRRLADLARDPDPAPAERRAAHESWRARHERPIAPWPLPLDQSRDPERPLAVGYLCGAIFGRDTADLLELLLEAHRAEGAPAICYVEGRKTDSVIEGLIRSSRRWTDLENVDDETACQIMRGDRLDLLVDLAGFDEGGRPLVLRRKPAPRVLAFASSPDAALLPGVDALLGHGAELHALPREQSLDCGRPPVAWRPPALAPKLAPRAPDEPLRIAVLSELARLSPARVGWLAQVMRALPEARLTLLTGRDPATAERAADGFADYGLRTRVDLVDPAENGFATGFELFRHVDLALLPAASDGHLDACRALWMGVPVVAAAEAGRSESVIAAAGRAEWIAADRESFVSIAAGLGADRRALSELRAGLRDAISRAPLRDLDGFTRAMSDAYRRTWRRACAAEARDEVA